MPAWWRQPGLCLLWGCNCTGLGRIVVSLPGFLQPIFHRTDMPTIYFPAYYLYRYMPLFDKMRVMMRFGLFTLIFTSLMAGLGAYLLTKRPPPKSNAGSRIGLLVLVFVDFYPGFLKDIRPIPTRPVDTWLATQPNTGALAQFPFDEESSQSQVLLHAGSSETLPGG